MYTIGIDVGGTNLKAGLVNEASEIVATSKMPLIWQSQEKLAADLAALAEDVVVKYGIGREEVSAIGIGFPGAVDRKRGAVIHTVNIPIHDMPVVEMLQSRWEIPVFLGNDADCAALGEFYHYGSEEIESFVLVTLGTGIGTGIIIRGQIWSGHNGCGGEGGHMVIVHDGDLCTCGRRGCWERYASANALIRQTRTAMEANRDSAMWQMTEGSLENVSGRTAFEAMRAGDAAAKAVVDQYIRYLSDGLVNLINLLQPDVVCLGGGVSHEREEDLLLPVQRRVREISYDRLMGVPSTSIITAKLGNDAGIIGAALLGK